MRLTTATLTLACFIGVLAPAGEAAAQFSNNVFTNRQLTQIRQQNSAQQFSVNTIRNSVINRSLPQFNSTGLRQNTFFGSRPSSSSSSKPFSGVNRSGPTVTPYLNLSASPFTGIQDYYNVVRPQLEQQKSRHQSTRQRKMQEKADYQQALRHHQLTEMAARNPFETTGSEAFAPTGHPVARMDMSGMILNNGGYFPPPSNAR